MSAAEGTPVQTLFRVERGDPDAHEVAALAVVIAAMAAAGGDAKPLGPRRRGWGSRWQVLKPRMIRGHGWGGR